MDAKEVWLSKPAEKIDRSDLAAFLAERNDVPEFGLWIFYFYLEKAFTQVSSQWLNVFKESPLSDVPLSHIPKSVYEISADWIKKLKTDRHPHFVMWVLDRILIDWAAHQAGAQPTSSKPQVAAFVVLAMVLRSKPNALTFILRMLRDRPRYQGEDKLPVIVWMMAQASQGDLSAGLYSWALNLLPLVGSNNCYSPQSMDLILQFVEMILSKPEAPTILVNEAVLEGERLIPPSSFEILVRLTFPASSARVEATKRFEAIYPLLKEVALAPGSKAMKQIFSFSLKLAGESFDNPVLAKEAMEIALCCVTKNVDCFKQWDILYKENIEASVALLKKLVDEWTDHFLKLSSSPKDTLTVNDTIYRFMMKNYIAIDHGVANWFHYKEADKSCRLILGTLSRDMFFEDLAKEKAVAEETATMRFLCRVRLNRDGAADKTKKTIMSLYEAAAEIDPTDLKAFLCVVVENHWPIPEKQILILIDYYGEKFSQVSFLWVKMFTESPLSTLIDVPVSQIPIAVYEVTVDFINKLPFETLVAFVMWASDLILSEWPGVVKTAKVNGDKSKVATFVVLAIVLRSKPDAWITFLPMMVERPWYQGEDKLPVIVWMMAQASQGDLSAGLYSWARNLLPLVGSNNCYSPQSMDLILQFVEMILSNPEAWNILVNEAVWERKRLIPPSSFEILVRLTFPASSSRVEATRRFEAIYPLLKEVALAPGRKAMKKIFTFSLKLAGEGVGSSVLAKEAIEIALCCVTKNVDCFKQWDILYKENIEASVALLKKLVDEWQNHFLKLSSSPNGTLIVNDTIYCFMIKNEEAMTEGVANGFLYKEADFICHLILKKLPFCRGSKSSRSYRPKKKSKLLKQ